MNASWSLPVISQKLFHTDDYIPSDNFIGTSNIFVSLFRDFIYSTPYFGEMKNYVSRSNIVFPYSRWLYKGDVRTLRRSTPLSKDSGYASFSLRVRAQSAVRLSRRRSCLSIWVSLIMPRHEWWRKNRKSDASRKRSVADKGE